MDEGVEHESDGEVGVGVLAVGQVGQEQHGRVVVHVQRGDLPVDLSGIGTILVHFEPK